MPSSNNGHPLADALSFYSSIVTVNPEGDSLVSDDTLEGLGTASFLLQALFGSLFRIANPDYPPIRRTSEPRGPVSKPSQQPGLDQEPSQLLAPDMAATSATARYGRAVGISTQALGDAAIKQQTIFSYPTTEQRKDRFSDVLEDEDEEEEGSAVLSTRLTDLLPEPGYFLAGAVSGGVSRTATAPLDRLKVYLLVNTKSPSRSAIAAAKSGRPFASLRGAGAPIVDAIVNLWKAGGFRTFFAGKLERGAKTRASTTCMLTRPRAQGMASTWSRSCPSRQFEYVSPDGSLMQNNKKTTSAKHRY